MIDAHADCLEARGDYYRAGGRDAARGYWVGELTHYVGLIIMRDKYAFVSARRILEN